MSDKTEDPIVSHDPDRIVVTHPGTATKVTATVVLDVAPAQRILVRLASSCRREDVERVATQIASLPRVVETNALDADPRTVTLPELYASQEMTIKNSSDGRVVFVDATAMVAAPYLRNQCARLEAGRVTLLEQVARLEAERAEIKRQYERIVEGTVALGMLSKAIADEALDANDARVAPTIAMLDDAHKALAELLGVDRTAWDEVHRVVAGEAGASGRQPT